MASLEGRTTAVLKYNLFDRGRKYNGIDRSNVDMKKMIEIMNSPAVQELVKTNSLYGYCGHDIRKRYGMRPPESTITKEGKTVFLEPAFRTIYLKALENGDVEYQQYFLKNDSGEFTRKQYIAEAGGFSTAVNYKQQGLGLLPVGFFGFDFVTQPNYATNIGDGQLFDGLFLPDQLDNTISCFDDTMDMSALTPEQLVVAELLEQKIFQQFDSIHQMMNMSETLQNSLDQVATLQESLFKFENKQAIIEKRQEDLYTGMVGEIRSFDSVCQDAQAYIDKKENNLNRKNDEKIHPKKISNFRNFFGFFG